MAALLFHPPQYQCVICQHNASLYRALSNPNIFTRPQSSGSNLQNASSSTASTAKKRDSHEKETDDETDVDEINQLHRISLDAEENEKNEPLYSELKRINNSVHWKKPANSCAERRTSFIDIDDG